MSVCVPFWSSVVSLNRKAILRAIASTVMMLSLVASSTPISALSLSPTHVCTLACCAGRPPHEAGSCLHGACAVHLPISHRSVKAESEPLCGIHTLMARQGNAERILRTSARSRGGDRRRLALAAGSGSEQSSTTSVPGNATSLAAASLTRPCLPECGAATVGSANQNRPREAAALCFANRARPPSDSSLLTARFTPTHSSARLHRQCGPRGPPIPVS